MSTEEWIECSKIVYTFVRDLEISIGKQIPLILTLFGGYRRDDYNSVLSLHTADLVTCLNTLCGYNINYSTEVKSRIALS